MAKERDLDVGNFYATAVKRAGGWLDLRLDCPRLYHGVWHYGFD